jgi:hypothetical protein
MARITPDARERRTGDTPMVEPTIIATTVDTTLT